MRMNLHTGWITIGGNPDVKSDHHNIPWRAIIPKKDWCRLKRLDASTMYLI